MIKQDGKGRNYDYDRRTLGCGYIYPYHGKKPTDTAEHIALGILYDLSDRRGIKHELAAVDDDVRPQIVEELAAIIRSGMASPPPAIDEYEQLMDALAAEQR